MTAIARALSRATQQLSATSDTPRLDAELLMAHALGIERDSLLLSDQRHMVPAVYQSLIDRRKAGEPVAYITGKRAFDARIEWNTASSWDSGDGWPRWMRRFAPDRTLYARDAGLDRGELESLCKLLNQLREAARAQA